MYKAVESAQKKKVDAVAFQKAIGLVHTNVKSVLHHVKCHREELQHKRTNTVRVQHSPKTCGHFVN